MTDVVRSLGCNTALLITLDNEKPYNITKMCSYISPVYAYPGEFEIEAMAAGQLELFMEKRN